MLAVPVIVRHHGDPCPNTGCRRSGLAAVPGAPLPRQFCCAAVLRLPAAVGAAAFRREQPHAPQDRRGPYKQGKECMLGRRGAAIAAMQDVAALASALAGPVRAELKGGVRPRFPATQLVSQGCGGMRCARKQPGRPRHHRPQRCGRPQERSTFPLLCLTVGFKYLRKQSWDDFFSHSFFYGKVRYTGRGRERGCWAGVGRAAGAASGRCAVRSGLPARRCDLWPVVRGSIPHMVRRRWWA